MGGAGGPGEPPGSKAAGHADALWGLKEQREDSRATLPGPGRTQRTASCCLAPQPGQHARSQLQTGP